MNTKAENQGKTGALDIAKYALAILIAAAGVYVFYAFTQWPSVVRGLLVALSFILAFVVLGFTEKGLVARGFFSDSLFELRKVVWPTRQEALRMTWVVGIVVVIMSLLLGGFDWIIQAVLKWFFTVGR